VLEIGAEGMQQQQSIVFNMMAGKCELGIIGIKYMIRMRTIRDTNDSNNEEENVI
jgi:hypothetical protein